MDMGVGVHNNRGIVLYAALQKTVVVFVGIGSIGNGREEGFYLKEYIVFCCPGKLFIINGYPAVVGCL